MTHDEKVRKKLRQLSYFPPSISDEQMMEIARGSMLLARIELNVAGNEFIDAFIDAMAGPVVRALERMARR